MADLVRLSQNGDVAVITIDNPPVNALSPGVPEGIDSAIKQAGANSQVRAIVIIGAGFDVHRRRRYPRIRQDRRGRTA